MVEWDDDNYHDELHLKQQYLQVAETNYPDIDDKQMVEKYSGAITPNVTNMFVFNAPDVRSAGGVVSILIGENVNISLTEHDRNSTAYKQEVHSFIECAYYDTSDLEYFFYRQPSVKRLEPNSGYVSGGTLINIAGIWFNENPTYGQFVFCKFGDLITRGKFISTTRSQCTTPAS
jgi:hypothetical protein